MHIYIYVIKLCNLFTYAHTSLHIAVNILRLYVTSHEYFSNIQRLQNTLEDTLLLETLNNNKISKRWSQRDSSVHVTKCTFFQIIVFHVRYGVIDYNWKTIILQNNNFHLIQMDVIGSYCKCLLQKFRMNKLAHFLTFRYILDNFPKNHVCTRGF